jgi:hypothetical protein
MCKDIRMSDTTNEELLLSIEVQYRTIIQMNRLLQQMVEEARARGMVGEMFKMQSRVELEERPRHEERPPLIL